MEGAAAKLEALFNKAESDLDYASRKLDTEFESYCNNENNQQNVSEMLRQIRDVKRDFAEITKEAAEIREAEKEAMKFFQTELLNVCSAVARLQQQAGMQVKKPEELTQMETLLGVGDSLAPLTAPVVPAPAAAAAAVQPDGGGDRADASKAAARENDTRRPRNEKTESPPLSASDRRVNSDAFISIDDHEFMSVSSLVRGRVKLSEVNQTYRILWQHFKEEGKCEALSLSTMHKMGLRVSGQTGDAKLKVLRSLKLLKISRNGDVQLL